MDKYTEYREILKSYLTEEVIDDNIVDQTPLQNLGLDSLGTVGLLVELEEKLEIEFAPETLTPRTFATANSLWLAVQQAPKSS